jgi:hypothetical protein
MLDVPGHSQHLKLYEWTREPILVGCEIEADVIAEVGTTVDPIVDGQPNYEYRLRPCRNKNQVVAQETLSELECGRLIVCIAKDSAAFRMLGS